MAASDIKYSRTESFLFVIVAYAVALIIPWLMLPYLSEFHQLIKIGILDIFATLIIFVFSYRLKNSSMYDPFWSVVPIPIVIYFMTLFPDGNFSRQILIVMLVSFWGIRLTFNWVRGWHGLHHEDWRYQDLQKQHGKAYWTVSLTGIHLLPTILVFLGLIPAYYAMLNPYPLNWIDIIASIVTFLAVIIEWVADEQLRSFRKLREFKSETIMEMGLWKYSRHPNYFGEISFWIGLSLFGLNFNLNEYWWTFAGALSMILLFVFVSIPMMEKRSLESKSGYKEHRKRISMLIPWIQKNN
jgi:steroid 5-alpha reductase family enzyme